MNRPPHEPIRGTLPPHVARYLILFVGALVAIGPLSLDAYLPAMPSMADAFHVGIVRINNTISIYLVAYGIGQFFGGAFSDQIGRKRIGLIGLSVFVLASLAIAFSTTAEEVQWLRFVQAIGGGFSTVICMAIVRDVYHVDELGRRMAMVTLIMLASPVIAPTLGATLLRFGWPAIFFFQAAYAGALAIVYATLVPETRPGDWRKLSVITTLRQCTQVIARKNADGRRPITYAITMALSASVFMTFITNSSFAYIDYFGVPASRFPLYFSVAVIGLICTNLFSMRRLSSSNAPTFFRVGLWVQATGVVLLTAAVLAGAGSIWYVVVPVSMIVAAFGLTGPSGSSQFIRNYDRLAGSASSLYTTMLFSTGAVFGAVSGVFFDGTLRPMAFTMFVASVAANSCALLTGAKIGRPASPVSGQASDATRDAA
ncbi:MAG TPA: multidrug effflux MFS transporter [Gammaproteobacteria bacterium]|nr:multidrug effflux MFS transporter [Gammaproteobacteria bacterium]